ncbi:MAG TPA: benzoate-CoA ligase family protein [Methylomirabilota bacterium]|nr:benzoate-CoA ligase family protein [Methylomirabilota bacterium]
MDNAAPLFVDAPVEEGRGEHTALVTPTGPVTYAGLQRLTDRAAGALRALGVEPEQRVALLMADGPGWAATFFGALKLGAVAVPLNTRLGPADLRTVLADCRPRVLVADEPLLAAAGIDAAAAGARAVLDWDTLVRDAPAGPLAAEPVGADAMAFWLYTSGTTGSPKAAVHCHRTLPACRHFMDLVGVTGSDRVFATSKLFFAYALGNLLLIPLFARATAYLHPGWPDPAAVAQVMREFAPTLFFSVPTVYARLLRADLPPETFRSARLCVSAGERLPGEVYDAWRARFGVEILDGIGATETVFMVLSNRPGQSRAGSSGVPVPGSEARILDAEGRPVADGEEGVLWVRTPSQAAAYYRRLDHSRRTFVGEWFRTGDVYRREADGHHVHCGREDDFFKVAGQWVSPVEVESVLLRHPAVVDGGVVGAPEPGGLIKPFAFVVPRDPTGSTEALRADVRRFLETALAPHQRPREIHIVSELPRTATGKLQRFRLRELAHGE